MHPWICSQTGASVLAVHTAPLPCHCLEEEACNKEGGRTLYSAGGEHVAEGANG